MEITTTNNFQLAREMSYSVRVSSEALGTAYMSCN